MKSAKIKQSQAYILFDLFYGKLAKLAKEIIYKIDVDNKVNKTVIIAIFNIIFSVLIKNNNNKLPIRPTVLMKNNDSLIICEIFKLNKSNFNDSPSLKLIPKKISLIQ
jgi:hypothetical protein